MHDSRLVQLVTIMHLSIFVDLEQTKLNFSDFLALVHLDAPSPSPYSVISGQGLLLCSESRFEKLRDSRSDYRAAFQRLLR